jgi:hypothetical protein
MSRRSKRNRVRLELETIRVANGGLLSPVAVVDYARDPTTALHDRFCWDDTKAARAYRIWQARKLIVDLEVIVPVGKRKRVRIQEFVSLQNDRSTEGGYRLTLDALRDVDLQAALLREAKAELDRFRAKYRTLKQLAGLIEQIDELLDGDA